MAEAPPPEAELNEMFESLLDQLLIPDGKRTEMRQKEAGKKCKTLVRQSATLSLSGVF